MVHASSVEQFCRSTFQNEGLLASMMTLGPDGLVEAAARVARANGQPFTPFDIRAAIDDMAASHLYEIDDPELGLVEMFAKSGTDEKCTCRSGGGCA